MKFNDTGTLINWQLDDINVVAPLHGKEDGGSRGGVYLCIPNFEALSPPFSIKHGEYRVTTCDSKLPHYKNLASDGGHDWGNVEVVTDWDDIAEANSKTLKVRASIRALSESAWVRPGFHPYFSIDADSFIDIAGGRLEIAGMPHDTMQTFRAASLAETVKLTTASFTAEVRCDTARFSEELSLVFVVWSDKQHEYVCIEPVIGGAPAEDGLPAPLTLVKGAELELEFSILARRVEDF
jgi:hypothetical protein